MVIPRRALTRIFQGHVDIKLNVVFKTSNHLRNAFRFNEQLPKCINSKVLYKYKCTICNNVYVGRTKHHLIVRQYEHLGKSLATDKPLRCSDKDATVIRKHCHSLEHLVSIDNFSIFGNPRNNYHLSLTLLITF